MKQLRDYKITRTIPVAWGEMDAFQHVNNAAFFRYFESARIQFFEEIAILEHMAKTRTGIILKSTGCKYIKPVYYPDTLHVGVKISEIHEHGFKHQYDLYSERWDDLVAVGEGESIWFDYKDKKKIPCPDRFVDVIAKYKA